MRGSPTVGDAAARDRHGPRTGTDGEIRATTERGDAAPALRLRTLDGLEADGLPPGVRLRKKDLALLAYLVLGGRGGHPRSRLAGLLWGDTPEPRARHSLTQAVSRLNRATRGGLRTAGDAVEVAVPIACDALPFLAPVPGDGGEPVPYAGDFLGGFGAGRGAEEFEAWADGVRPRLRMAALQRLELRGRAAEARGDWPAALACGEESVRIDRAWEPGHRRIMRAWRALGDARRAVAHFAAFTAWLDEEFGGGCDPETAELARAVQRSLARPDGVPVPPPDQAPAAPLPPLSAVTGAAGPDRPRGRVAVAAAVALVVAGLALRGTAGSLR